MVIPRARVTCTTCKQAVEKTQTVLKEGHNREYECFDCFQSKRNIKVKGKLQLYCERCRYKFKGSENTCPYCGKSDLVICGDPTLQELI